jgi:hypothetical protein
MKINLHWSLILTSSLLVLFSISAQIVPFQNFERYQNSAPTLSERIEMQDLGIAKVLSEKEPFDRKLLSEVIVSNKDSIISSHKFMEASINSFTAFYRILFVLLIAHFFALYLHMRRSKPNKSLKQDK